MDWKLAEQGGSEKLWYVEKIYLMAKHKWSYNVQNILQWFGKIRQNVSSERYKTGRSG